MTDSLNYSISFVVDRLPSHYYQAELLLSSLEHRGNIPKENIVVHCLSRVDTVFFEFLEKNHYRYKIIEPFLDGTYCNKLQQLESFSNAQTEAVILLDTDTFLLEPFTFDEKNLILGKIVDGPNPPTQLLEQVFKEAQLTVPNTVPTDFNIREGLTLDCYFNGGFYFIPKQYIDILSKEWKKWATWLYERREQYATIHIDQISMAMALSSASLPYGQLSSNYNMPIHRIHEPHYFHKDQDIFLLHYHSEITQFGLLSDTKISHPDIVDAVNKANKVITEEEESIFYEEYRRSLIPALKKPDNFEEIEQELQKISSRLPKKIKLILHAGTPKTGTTSLQKFLAQSYTELSQFGYLYPKNYISEEDPKHQWIIQALRKKKFSYFFKKLLDAVHELNESHHTIIFSTEGLYNHWWDLSQEAKWILSKLQELFHVEILIYFREPKSFLESLYKQNLINPQLPDVSSFGRDISFTEYLKDEWFLQHLDFFGFLAECETLFKKENIILIPYFGNTVLDFCHQLKIPLSSNQMNLDENTSINSIGVEFVRIINRYNFPMQKKKSIVKSIKEVEYLCQIGNDSILSEADKEMITIKAQKGLKVLFEKYRLFFG